MEQQPQRTTEEQQPLASSATSALLRPRALWAGAAILAVGMLSGAMFTSSMVSDASEHSDPTALAVSTERPDRGDRSSGRPSLIASPETPPATQPSGGPAAPTASAPTSVAETSQPAATPTAQPSLSSGPTMPPGVVSTSAPSAQPTTSQPAPSLSTSPQPSTSTPPLGTVVGTRWATSAATVRSGPGQAFGVVGTIERGEAVQITNVLVDGRWQQVRFGGKMGFVAVKYLSDEQPKPQPQPTTTPMPTPEPSESVDTASCAAAKEIESGLTANTVRVLRAICNEFPNITSYAGLRSDGDSYHSEGRAIDAMISGEAGWEVAEWVRDNAGELGVIEVIYAQKIWTSERSSEGWRDMEDRGSATANHYDHVHVSVG